MSTNPLPVRVQRRGNVAEISVTEPVVVDAPAVSGTGRFA
jgi:hypothetical protein